MSTQAAGSTPKPETGTKSDTATKSGTVTKSGDKHHTDPFWSPHVTTDPSGTDPKSA